jgi:hypothetical protein
LIHGVGVTGNVSVTSAVGVNVGVGVGVFDGVSVKSGVHTGMIAVAMGVAVGAFAQPPNCGQVGSLSGML